MGTKLDGKGGKLKKVEYHGDGVTLPETFTAGVNKWPNCHSTIGFIKDQANCGSCWAVAASEVIADRVCIANYGKMMTNSRLNEGKPPIDMSAEDIMSCCKYCGDGCDGGYPTDAMRYWYYTGVVTGGWYGSNCGCQPYMIKPCGSQGCSGDASTPSCSSACRGGYNVAYKNDKHKATNHYELSSSVTTLMTEIYNNGPIECGFEVYENFMHYTSGVYDKIEGRLLGGHAVKIIGWGKENGVDYWLINNSWNTTWGLTGQFKYLRGISLGGMQSSCVAGTAKTNDANFMLKC